MSRDPGVVTIELDGQEFMLAIGGAYEFGFRHPRRRIVTAYLQALKGQEMTLETFDGVVMRRRIRDLEHIWDTPQSGANGS